MTLYVVDSSQPLPPSNEDYVDALHLIDGDSLVLTEGVAITAIGYQAGGVTASGFTRLVIDGVVESAHWNAIAMHGVLSIGSTGQVRGAEGVFLTGSYTGNAASVVNNAGLIFGQDTGIYIEAADSVINNTGVITGDGGIWIYPTDNNAASLTVNNSGTIRGTGGAAINGVMKGSNAVINSGTIEGSVFFGDGNDLYDGRGGSITGAVWLSMGDDVAYGGSGSESFYVQG